MDRDNLFNCQSNIFLSAQTLEAHWLVMSTPAAQNRAICVETHGNQSHKNLNGARKKRHAANEKANFASSYPLIWLSHSFEMVDLR